MVTICVGLALLGTDVSYANETHHAYKAMMEMTFECRDHFPRAYQTVRETAMQHASVLDGNQYADALVELDKKLRSADIEPRSKPSYEECSERIDQALFELQAL